MPTAAPETKPPHQVPVRSRGAGSDPVCTAVDAAIEHLTYLADSLNSAGDLVRLEIHLGCIESIIKDYLEPARQSLVELRAELGGEAS